MNLEFVRLTSDSDTNVDLDDVFEFEVPELDDLSKVDSFISKRIYLTAGDVRFGYNLNLWYKNNQDQVHNPDTYKQVPYGTMIVKYPNYVSDNSTKRQRSLVKAYGKKYEFLSALLNCEECMIFFGIQEDDILFNMYVVKKNKTVVPHFIFKIAIKDIIEMHDESIKNIDTISVAFKNENFKFFGITRDSYNSLMLMNNVSAAMYGKNRSHNVLKYVFEQARVCIYVYEYFMYKLRFYKESKIKTHVVEDTSAQSINNKIREIRKEDSSVMANIEDNDIRIIYLNDNEYVYTTKETTCIHHEDSGRHWKIQHEFEVKGHKRQLKSGKVIEVAGYTKGKGLPKKSKQTIYLDAKKGGKNGSE